MNLHLIPEADRAVLREALKIAFKKKWLEMCEKPPKAKPRKRQSAKTASKEQLAQFETFWKAFNYKKGKAGALQNWLEIKMTDELSELIIHAANKEAAARFEIEKRGSTPIWAQGWLTQQRWLDYEDSPRTMTIGVKKEIEPEGWEAFFEEYTGKKPQYKWLELMEDTRKEIREAMNA